MIVGAMTGSASPVVYEPLPADDPQMRRPDVSLAGRLIGWLPKTSVRQGIAMTIEWFAAAMETEVGDGGALAASSSGLAPLLVAVAQEAAD